MSKTNLPETPKSEEVDIIQIFTLIGNAIKSVFDFIVGILKYVFKLFIMFALFIRRNIIVLVIAGAIGFVIGSIIDYFFEPYYSSTIIVKPNFGINDQLIDNTKLLGQLAASKDSIALASALEITPAQAGQIRGITIKAKSNTNDKLMAFNRFVKGADSLTLKAISFESYEKNLDISDFAYYYITVDSYDRHIFNKIESKLIETKISAYLKSVQDTEHLNLLAREAIIKSTLSKIDSLRSDYRELMMSDVEQEALKPGSGGTNFYMGSSNLRPTKEMELFKLETDLNNELSTIALKKVNNQKAIHVLSAFQDPGIYVNVKVRNWYILAMIALAIAGLLALEFNKFLRKYEEELKLNE
ncbi:hypothetical protein AAFN75_06335 [Algibacter sp. AS12]|uniref:hypothetical protein n=1 Tax=Algibacter sp. AS12 TaxID=3135773 RepID=UPI00398BA18B